MSIKVFRQTKRVHYRSKFLGCFKIRKKISLLVHLFKTLKNDFKLSLEVHYQHRQSIVVIIQIMVQLIVQQSNPNPQQAQLSCKQKLRRQKKHFLITGIMIAAMVTAGLLFYFLFLIPQITVMNKSTISMPDSSQFTMVTVRVQDRNIYEQNFDQILYVTYPEEQRKGRLLQQGKGLFYVHAFNQELGISIRMSPQSNTSFFVNQDTFIDYAEKQADDTSRKLAEAEYTNKTNLASGQQFFIELGNIFTQAAEKAGTPNVQVKFVNQVMANIKLNGGFLEFDTSAPKRNLMETKIRNLFFLTKILSVVKSIVPKVASFMIESIRKYGPTIGKVVGGVVGGVGGFLVGGPAGAFQGAMKGMQLGGMIGGAASSLVNACIPQGTLRISCTPSSLGSVMSQFGSSSGGMGLLTQGFGGVAGSFGGLANIAGNLFNNIPKQALSNFGFGSIFSKFLGA